MEVADNLDFKHVSNLVKNTYTIPTKSFIQMILDRIVQIFIMKILIMRSIWYACIQVIIASKLLYLMRLEMDIYQWLGIKESWRSLLPTLFSLYLNFFAFTLLKLRLLESKQVKISKFLYFKYLLGSFIFSFSLKPYIMFTI